MPQAMGHARGYDKPNVGIVGVLEGQCFQAGEPVTFFRIWFAVFRTVKRFG